MSAAIATAAISGFGSGDLAGLIPPAFTFRQSWQGNAADGFVLSPEVVPVNTYTGHSASKPTDTNPGLAVSLLSPLRTARPASSHSAARSAGGTGGSDAIMQLKNDGSKASKCAISAGGALNMAVSAAMSGKQSSGSNFVAIARDNYSASPTVRMAAPGGGGTAPPPPGEPDDPPLPLTGSTIVMLLLAAAYAHKPKAKGLLTNTNITN